MAKLYVFSYEEGVRSSRKIEQALKTNIEYMWLCGGLIPDFKTIADFRRNNAIALTLLFTEFASFADSAGMYGKRVVAIDGTKIRASNSKKRNISKNSLRRRKEHHESRAKEYLRELEQEDDLEKSYELSSKAQDAQAQADEANTLLSDMERAKETELSLTDKDARCMGSNRQGVHVAYNVQSATDAKYHLIAEFAITNRADDHGELVHMASATELSLRKRGITFLADKGYFGSEELSACRDLNLNCIVCPQKSPSTQEASYSFDNFSYDAQTDSYICPKGARITSNSKAETVNKLYSNRETCISCDAQDECKSPGFNYRRIRRRPNRDILDWAKERYLENIHLYKMRQQIVEHPFGTVKRAMGADHFLLRGFDKVKCEMALLFTGYNLKRVRNVMGFDGMMAKLEEYGALIKAPCALSAFLFISFCKVFDAFFSKHTKIAGCLVLR